MTKYARTPPRCPELRHITNWEEFKFKVFGRVYGFDPDEEARCNRYLGHGEFKGQERHMDTKCRSWRYT